MNHCKPKLFDGYFASFSLIVAVISGPVASSLYSKWESRFPDNRLRIEIDLHNEERPLIAGDSTRHRDRDQYSEYELIPAQASPLMAFGIPVAATITITISKDFSPNPEPAVLDQATDIRELLEPYEGILEHFDDDEAFEMFLTDGISTQQQILRMGVTMFVLRIVSTAYFALWLIFVLKSELNSKRLLKWHRNGLCHECGYEVEQDGSQPICPECGNPTHKTKLAKDQST